MARKRAETAKRKIAKADNTSSVPKECLEVESNGNCKRNRSRLVTRSRAMKRDVKSGEEIACSEKVTENRDDSKVVPKRGPPKQERKRNASSLGRESPSKKIKLDSGETTTICGERKLRKRRVFVQEESGDNITQKSLVQEQQASAIKNQSKEKSPMKGKATPKNVNSPRQKEKLKAPPGSTPSPMKKRQTAGKKLKLNSYGLNNGESDAKPTTSHKTLSVDEGASSDSDSEGVAWEDVDEATVNHEIDDCDKDNPGTSSTKQHRSPSKKNVEISITVPGGKKKKGWSQEDVMKYIKRAINRFKKEVSTTVHKVHLLTLVGHGFSRNGVCNNRSLQAVVLSHVPNNFVTGNKRKWDVVQLTNFLKWFQSEFSSTEDIKTGDSETDQQIARVQNLSEIFVSVLRALGFLTRLVYSLQPVSAKADLEGRTSPKSLKKKIASQGNKTAKLKSTKKSEIGKRQEAPSRGKLIKTEIKTEKEVIEVGKNVKEGNKESIVQGTGKKNSKKRKVTRTNEEQVDHKSDSSKKENMKKRRLRKRAKVEYSLSGNENGSDADEEWNAQSSDSEEETEGQKNSESEANFRKKDKTPLGRKKRTQNGSSSSLSFVDPMDDDSDFEVTSKPLMKKRVSGGGSKGKRSVAILSDDSDESVKCLGTENKDKGTDWWSEVYLPGDKKWICVHLESSSVNHPELCEQHATQPLVYVVSFDNNNAAKDVTNRYASCWMSKTRKLRLDPDWWEETLHPYKTRSKKMDQMEDSQLEGQLNDKPLPTSITEFKNHPLYVLKRHLLKFEAIYPESAVILGYCRGEAVYSRDCLHMLHTREKWLNEALVVKQGEKAYKVVKGRPKRNQPIHERDSVTIDLFGRWQTEDYKPPPAKDGKVPRNEYGNVELFKACMLPPGTSHIQIPGIQRVAKKLGIDCAQAVVGFDFHCGFSHPVIDGVVVCEEYESALLDAWREDEEEAERKKAEKREKRVLASWKLLTRSLLIKERLKKRYNTQEPEMSNKSTNEVGDDAVLPSTSVSWPLNRQDGRGSVASDGHCHVFLESGYKQDSVTGEWSKTCSCGLTLPFEKM